MKRFFVFTSIILTVFSFNTFAQKRAMTPDDLWAMKRVGSYDVSPDGKTIAFTITSYNMDENKGSTDIWLINSDGSDLRQLLDSKPGKNEPKFSPDGKKFAYVYKNQVWICNPDGTDDKQITNLYSGVSGILWSPDSKKMLFVSDVYPDCQTQDCNEQKDKAKEESKVKAKVITELMYRAWNRWRGDKRSHLFLLDLNTKESTDLTLNSKFDVPPVDLGSSKDYSFSPESDQVAFTMNTSKVLATSTNNDIFVIDLKDIIKDKPTPYKKISVSPGSDCQPVYSPDGKYIAFTSKARAGFESDKNDIVLYNRKTGNIKNLTKDIDISASEIEWTPNSKNIFYTADHEIYSSIYKLNIETGKNVLFHEKNVNRSLLVSRDGSTLFFEKQKSTLPTEIFSINTDGSGLKQITNSNSELLSRLEFTPIEIFWAKGASGTKVQSILIKPPFFDANKKYPVILLIHGGPQGHWEDDFHYRWNIQLFASKGYVVVAPNPRGSTGYGEKFKDEISGDWGGKPYVDIMNSFDYALKNYKFIDPKNTFAAGASYGGYMINWIEGHTDRFNALVCHDGVFDLTSMYGSTEELWFPEWEFKGTPWTNPAMYKKFSPSTYVENFKTPMLIVHGANDFRVPETQAMELFTSLQRKGVESKFLYFPDEYHFVVKPQDAILWWDTIFDWFEQHKVK